MAGSAALARASRGDLYAEADTASGVAAKQAPSVEKQTDRNTEGQDANTVQEACMLRERCA